MRIEKDSMGEMQVPDNALYGASTQRAALNFQVSNLRFSKGFIAALGVIKLAAARANQALGLLDEKRASAIVQACQQVIDGSLYEHFVVDLFQTGSGTSTNMNANEVICNRAIEILGGQRGDKKVLHPNDHVNMSQSSNDVIPSAIHISTNEALCSLLLPALEKLHLALNAKAIKFANVIKAGRTHLQDATPITLGQEFSGYAAQIQNGIKRLKNSQAFLEELALGGTAVGTGLNTHPEFAKRTIAEICRLTKGKYVEASNHFEAQGSRDAVTELGGQLKTVATGLLKIANDLRWLSSGPRCSIGEIFLPEIQPGSSIMPAKVNPVICESVMMVCVHVIGNDAAITAANTHGNFELNVMLPVMAHNVLQAVELLAGAANNFVDNCISGIEADVERCKDYAEKSLATCTALAPIIGYDKAADVAKLAFKKNITVRQAVIELGVLSSEKANEVLDLMKMTVPGL